MTEADVYDLFFKAVLLGNGFGLIAIWYKFGELEGTIRAMLTRMENIEQRLWRAEEYD